MGERLRKPLLMVALVGSAGALQFQMFFSDLGPHETLALRTLGVSVLCLVFGMGLGFAFRSWWIPLCGGSLWGSILWLSLVALLGRNPTNLELGLALACCGCLFAGGAIGAVIRRRPGIH